MPEESDKKMTTVDVSDRSQVLESIDITDDKVISYKIKETFDDNTIMAVKQAAAPYENTILLIIHRYPMANNTNDANPDWLSLSQLYRYKIDGDDLHLDIYDLAKHRKITYLNGDFVRDEVWDILEVEFVGDRWVERNVEDSDNDNDNIDNTDNIVDTVDK
jgi:hypothetical protein